MPVRSRLSTLSGTALAVALVVGAVSPLAHAEVGPVRMSSAPSPPSKALPAAVDVRTSYQAQVSCDPRPKPGVTAFAALMRARYKTGAVHSYRPCRGDVSEHYDGRALDWMLSVKNPQQRAVASSVVAWLSARGGVMARRFGISYIVWNKKMWREYAPERGWTAYTGSDPHTSHVHFSFSWDGAMKRTSWWTGRATKVVDLGPCKVYAGQFAPLYKTIRTGACPTRLAVAPASPYRVAVFGQKSAQIASAQRRLGVAADGQFGSATFTKLVAWQTRARVPVTGVLDKATWARLVRPVPPTAGTVAKPKTAAWAATRYTPYKRVTLRQGSRGAAVKVLQRALKGRANGGFGPKTRGAVVAFQRRQHITCNGVVGPLVWSRLEKRDYPLIAYRKLRLRYGSTGRVVALVQRLVKVSADGRYGPRTARAVKVVQGRAHLSRTGVVSGWTWVAVENLTRR
jgi:peptidoglycan hydrolase-like protein with peptidoglycan-binding domain